MKDTLKKSFYISLTLLILLSIFSIYQTIYLYDQGDKEIGVIIGYILFFIIGIQVISFFHHLSHLFLRVEQEKKINLHFLMITRAMVQSFIVTIFILFLFFIFLYFYMEQLELGVPWVQAKLTIYIFFWSIGSLVYGYVFSMFTFKYSKIVLMGYFLIYLFLFLFFTRDMLYLWKTLETINFQVIFYIFLWQVVGYLLTLLLAYEILYPQISYKEGYSADKSRNNKEIIFFWILLWGFFYLLDYFFLRYPSFSDHYLGYVRWTSNPAVFFESFFLQKYTIVVGIVGLIWVSFFTRTISLFFYIFSFNFFFFLYISMGGFWNSQRELWYIGVFFTMILYWITLLYGLFLLMKKQYKKLK